MALKTSYDWIIRETQTWPPRSRPRPPFGATQLEVMRSCVLRSVFENSWEQPYEPRLDFTARIGTAFHRAFESLFDDPPSSNTTPAEAAAIAHERLRLELQKQEALSAQRAREASLPRDQQRIESAYQAIMLEARHLAKIGFEKPRVASGSVGQKSDVAPTINISEDSVLMELRVCSRDGVFEGRIDRVERSKNITRLYDYKLAFRDDLPERYQRQLQLYAWLWHECAGYWPDEAVVVYPLTRKTFQVPVDPVTCEAVVTEYREVIERLNYTNRAHYLSAPGEVCQVCQFRPWCRGFWRAQSEFKSTRDALTSSTYGIEGTITTIELRDNYWRIEVNWSNAVVLILAPIERFPQMREARSGDRIRALDMKLSGQPLRPRATVDNYSEIFILRE